MYPWYRDSVGGQLGQLCGPMATTIKTENGYNDCMLALDYATQSKVSLLCIFFCLLFFYTNCNNLQTSLGMYVIRNEKLTFILYNFCYVLNILLRINQWT